MMRWFLASILMGLSVAGLATSTVSAGFWQSDEGYIREGAMYNYAYQRMSIASSLVGCGLTRSRFKCTGRIKGLLDF